MFDLFISKSSQDDEIALTLYQLLENNGIHCWIDKKNLDTSAGDHYAEDIVDAIENSKALLLILSNKSNKSAHCVNEVTTACDKKKKVFVYQIESLKPDKTLIYYLSQKQWVKDLEITNTGNFKKIIQEVATFLDKFIELNNNNFIDKEYQKKANFIKFAKKNYEKRRSFVSSIYNLNEMEIDSNHLYENITRIDIVDSEKNDWRSYRFLTIKNVSNKPTTFVIHRESGESKAQFKEMKIRAKLGNVSGKKLRVESLTKIQPNDMQIFRIFFPKPLDPGESVTISYRIDWPNEPSSYYMEDLSQSISLSRYTKGVEKLTFAVFEPYKILSSFLVEVDKMNIEKLSEIKPQMLDINEEDLLKPLHDREYYGVKYTINEPNSILYQIKYSKEEIDDLDDDDDFF